LVLNVRVITFKIEEDLLEKLDLFAVNNKLYRSEVVRDAIKFYLSNYKNIKEKCPMEDADDNE